MDFCLVFFGFFLGTDWLLAFFNLYDNILSGCYGIGLFVFSELGFFLASGTFLVFFFVLYVSVCAGDFAVVVVYNSFCC